MNTQPFEEIDVYIRLPQSLMHTCESIKSKLNQFLSNDKVINSIFHITLYQGRVNQKSLKKIFEIVRSITKEQEVFKVVMNDNLRKVGNNVFWEAERSVTIQELHEKLLIPISALKEGLLQQFQQLDFRRAEEESTLGDIKAYGMANVKKRYNPHITVAYQIGDKILGSLCSVITESFHAESVGVGRIGFYGNVIEELASFSFLKHE